MSNQQLEFLLWMRGEIHGWHTIYKSKMLFIKITLNYN